MELNFIVSWLILPSVINAICQGELRDVMYGKCSSFRPKECCSLSISPDLPCLPGLPAFGSVTKFLRSLFFGWTQHYLRLNSILKIKHLLDASTSTLLTCSSPSDFVLLHRNADLCHLIWWLSMPVLVLRMEDT